MMTAPHDPRQRVDFRPGRLDRNALNRARERHDQDTAAMRMEHGLDIPTPPEDAFLFQVRSPLRAPEKIVRPANPDRYKIWVVNSGAVAAAFVLILLVLGFFLQGNF